MESKYGKGKVSKYFIVPLLYPFQYIYEKFDCKRKIQELVDNGRSSSSSDDIDLDEWKSYYFINILFLRIGKRKKEGTLTLFWVSPSFIYLYIYMFFW